MDCCCSGAAPPLSLRLRAKRASSSFLSPHHHQCHPLHSLSPLLLRCSLPTQPQQQGAQMEMPFIAQYLISSFGFSPDRALRVSANKHQGSIKSDRVDSVITFLKEIGLEDPQIRNLISLDPYILGSNVEKTLKPRARQLMDGGFAGEILAQLILSNPQCLRQEGALSRLRFWRNFVGDNDEVLLKVLRRNRFLITLDIDEHVLPRVNLLKEFGLSNEDISNLLMKGQACFVRSQESLRQILERTEQLGFSRGSSMFICGL